MTSKRKPLDRALEERFLKGEAQPASSTPPPPAAQTSSTSKSPWDDLQPIEREATVRLNVDIAVSLNDKLAEKARQLRKPKTELVRRLLEWALEHSIE